MRIVMLPRRVQAGLRRQADAAQPREACGLLLGEEMPEGHTQVTRLVPMNNIADDPRTGYLIDPEDYLRTDREAAAEGLAVVGVYHSHPDGKPTPSETDRELAWPGWSYVIIGADGELRAWRLRDRQFEEETIRS
ncbi:MAG: M67 family metallopeptidase [Ectothiorhodospiraceae bacterium]|nr:M67 family metallopeptidase [Ectothiorhodospiraceae bacterium]MCH8506981.1 M67 family metallopeptidase [Ectothiorhodospiraceae bacterium]